MRGARLVYKSMTDKDKDKIRLGFLVWSEDGTGVFVRLTKEDCYCLENEGVPKDVLWDLLCGIKEDVEELSSEKKFDFDKYTKYWINEFRFEEVTNE